MAKRDVYNFDISANNKKAKDAFEELKGMAAELDKATENLGNNPNSFKSMTDMIRKMSDVMSKHTELTEALDEEHVVQVYMNNNGLVRDIEKSKAMVKKATKDISKDFENVLDTQKNKTGRRPSIMPDLEVYSNELSEAKKKLSEMKDLRKQIERETSKTLSLGDNAIKTKFINHNQSENYRKTAADLMGEKYQGGTKEERSQPGFEPSKGSHRDRAQKTVTDSLQKIGDREARVKEIADDTSIENEEMRLSLIKKQKTEIKDYQKLLNEAQTVLLRLDSAQDKIGDQGNTIASTPIREKDDRSNPLGRIHERASAIGMAAVGATAYTAGSMYSQGAGLVDGMREDTLNIGYKTGDYDFRGIRQDKMEAGAENGWKGKEMLGFTNSVLSTAGFTNKENLTDQTNNLADFSKFAGVGTESATAYTEGMYETGGVTTADQAKAIQDGFLGAIKASGMEGREKEQIDALTAINANLFSGREGSNEEVKARASMASVLASSGNRAFQGENLAGFMTSADDAIKNMDPFSNLALKLGVGTDPELSGEDWGYNTEVMKQEGFTAEKFNQLQKVNMNIAQGNTKGAAKLTKDDLASDVDIIALRELMEANPNGIAVGSEAENKFKELEKDGEEVAGDNEEAYTGSADQIAEAQEAYAEKLKTLLNDNDLVKGLTKLNKNLQDLGSNNAGTAMTGAAITGLAAGISTGLVGALGPALAPLLGKFSTKAFSAVAPVTAGKLATKVKGGANATKAVAKGLEGGTTATKAVVDGVEGTAKSSRIGTMFSNGGQAVSKAGKNVLGKLKGISPGIGGKLDDMGTLFSKGGSSIASKFKGIMPKMGDDIASNVFNSKGVGSSKIGNWLSGAGEKVSKVAGNVTSKAKGIMPKMGDDIAKGVFNSSDEAASGMGSWLSGVGKGGGKLLKGAGKVASKVALPLTAALSAYDIINAKDKNKAIGETAGGLGGMAAGAAAGSFLGPVGTVVGGIAGYVGGTKVGAKAGEAIGNTKAGAWMQDTVSTGSDWIKEKSGNAWDWVTGKDNKAEASELDEEDQEGNSSTSEEEKATNNSKVLAEKIRQKNIIKETENLSIFDALLSRVSDLLAESRAQNGMIGTPDGDSSGSSSNGVGAVGYTGDGDYWTDTDVRKHDLGKTSNTLTAEQLDEIIAANAPEGSLMLGMGSQFMDAQASSGLDARYLLAHSAQETGWGDPKNGYAKDDNWFGVGAFDNNPDNAKNYDLGIQGGANWIAENYYDKGQTTVDSMRNNGGTHEYATDPAWDEKIASIMKSTEKYTNPSNVTVSTQVNYTGTGDAKADGKAIGTTISNTISSRYTQEQARV